MLFLGVNGAPRMQALLNQFVGPICRKVKPILYSYRHHVQFLSLLANSAQKVPSGLVENKKIVDLDYDSKAA
jgi:hypothetical protein